MLVVGVTIVTAYHYSYCNKYYNLPSYYLIKQFIITLNALLAGYLTINYSMRVDVTRQDFVQC